MMPRVDIAIITVIPEEYAAVANRLEAEGCSVKHDPGARSQPNQYGWVTGELADDQGRVFQLVLAAALSPGPTHMANAVNATIVRFRPRYVLLVGIAGGFGLDGLTRGDVAVSSVIYDYEYGMITTEFQPRHDNTYQVDGTLYRSAVTLDARDKRWSEQDTKLRPHGVEGRPKLVAGAIASGSKVVDNAEYVLFARVHASWPKLLAVEMEGAGAVATINAAVSGGRQVGFLMVRGISDMPKVASEPSPSGTTAGNTVERDTWKKYAAAVAATVREGCDIRPCPQAAALAPSKRDQLVQALGRSSLDAILIAADTDTVLWTDDLVLGLLGRTEFSVARVWTQAGLYMLRQEEAVTQQMYDHAVARLVGWHYQGMLMNEDTLIAAAEVTDWRMDYWPVPAVMKCLHNPSADVITRLRIAAQAVKAIWRRDLPDAARHSFLSAILSGLQSVHLVKRLNQAIPMVFSVDVFSADEVQDHIAAWLRHPPGLLLP